eukprot:5765910-Pleurochrysis_carterae.AAC.4
MASHPPLRTWPMKSPKGLFLLAFPSRSCMAHSSFLCSSPDNLRIHHTVLFLFTLEPFYQLLCHCAFVPLASYRWRAQYSDKGLTSLSHLVMY